MGLPGVLGLGEAGDLVRQGPAGEVGDAHLLEHVAQRVTGGDPDPLEGVGPLVVRDRLRAEAVDRDQRAVDGPLVSVYGLRPEAVSYNERADALQRVWIAARHSLRDVFEQVSVADLASGTLPPAVDRLTADDDAWQPH